ncbi:uracil-DNA glycosylase [uncultured Ramlibacter sp.]|uniref:uracil-DNA glycosylase n=1 Tax=uncultured Ramlibacter sp. TaxID=260755 RepID=UPI00260D49B8|nr:uracil-DNA glycosylase [uncultured Ramlibacter sp.]
MDIPKTLASESERVLRTAMLSQPHVADLVRLVERMRKTKGPDYKIPDFDPLDGGDSAEVLFLLEAPGPKAVTSGFVSRNNPDETAKNFFLLNAEAGVDRSRTITWNAVPWYIGSDTKIRPANREDVREADAWLQELLEGLRELRVVMFVGKKALYAEDVVRACRPDVEMMTMPHPSPMFINRASGNRERVLAALQQLSRRMTASDA